MKTALETSFTEKPFLQALAGQKTNAVPFWLMRQAGRYLPEYRAVRGEAGGFLNMVFDPVRAAEVTLQPLRRFGMDAAILFSDILTVPLALGQDVRFEEGEGPVLGELHPDRLGLEKFDSVMAPVYDAVREVRSGLAREGFGHTALIGFAGAPWTVACYMVEGRGSRDYAKVKTFAYDDPKEFSRLIDLLTTATARYLSAQIAAGAEAVQIFDSWAGALDDDQFRRWVIGPAQKIVGQIKREYPGVLVIGFPRGAGALYADYADQTGVDAVGLDTQVPLSWAAREIQTKRPVQGNLDPVCLLAGGNALESRTKKILETLAGGPFVFNLGHGVIKDTPPDHVAHLARIIRNWTNS